MYLEATQLNHNTLTVQVVLKCQLHVLKIFNLISGGRKKGEEGRTEEREWRGEKMKYLVFQLTCVLIGPTQDLLDGRSRSVSGLDVGEGSERGV